MHIPSSRISQICLVSSLTLSPHLLLQFSMGFTTQAPGSQFHLPTLGGIVLFSPFLAWAVVGPKKILCLCVCSFYLHLQSNYICISLFHSHFHRTLTKVRVLSMGLREHFIWELVLFQGNNVVTYHHISREQVPREWDGRQTSFERTSATLI